MTIFCEFSWPLGYFQRFGVFETDFCFKKTQISQLWYHEMFVFSGCYLSQKTFLLQKLIVFSCLQFADCYMWPRICFVVWFLCFNHYYGIFWKVSLKKSWCCRKHVFVFEIVSLKGLNKFLIKLSFFFLWLLGKRFVRHYGRKFEDFSILGIDFESSLSKGLNVLAIFRYVVKKNRGI